VNLLLDTHIFLWFISGDSKLPVPVREAIVDSANNVFLSVVSIWEATVKFQIGKLRLPQPPGVYLPSQRARHLISPLGLTEPSVARLSSLPAYHRDPFDRMLICQAIEHGLAIATVNALVMQYGVPILGRS
jgi:PIN domain nuclease of toxin-antitoxin system